MIKQTITEINQIIIDSGLIERYGKYCSHHTDAPNGIPYGKGKEKDCKGNTYTFDERNENVAYLEMQPFSIKTVNSLYSQFSFTFVIHHFATVKKANTDVYYQRQLQLFQTIYNAIKAKKSYHNSEILSNSIQTNIPDSCEYGTVTIKFNMFLDCSYVPDLDPQNC